jgi:hypothetical protein
MPSGSSRVLKKASCRLLKKIQRRGARKIDERRRTYSTLQRGDFAQRSIWVFFSSLLGDLSEVFGEFLFLDDEKAISVGLNQP